jgi:hypothetical protein
VASVGPYASPRLGCRARGGSRSSRLVAYGMIGVPTPPSRKRQLSTAAHRSIITHEVISTSDIRQCRESRN